MASVIQIDDEVHKELEKWAVKYGLVFSTPNQVLRIRLGLENPVISNTVPPKASSPSLVNASTTEIHLDTENKGKDIDGDQRVESHGRGRQRIGARLLREHGLNAQKGYFSKTGVPYQQPAAFPAVFFDPKGYLIIDDFDSMNSNPSINVGKQVSIPSGIGSIPGYVVCSHTHK